MSEALTSRLERLEADVAEIKAILSHLVPMITRIDQRLTSEPPPARRADVAAVLEELERLAQGLDSGGSGRRRAPARFH